LTVKSELFEDLKVYAVVFIVPNNRFLVLKIPGIPSCI